MAEEHTCEECDEAFDSADKLEEHQQDAHESEQNEEQADDQVEQEQPDESADESVEDTTAADESDTSTADTEPALDLDAASDSGKSPLDRTVLEGNYTVLGAGFVVGVLLSAALLFSSGIATSVGSTGASGISEAAAQNKLSTYLADNEQAMRLPPGSDISVQQVGGVEGSDLYEAQLLLTADVQNQTIEREFSAYLTGNGRYIFFGQAIDTTQPIAEQIQQQPPAQ